jgi:acetylglutamate synthase
MTDPMGPDVHIEATESLYGSKAVVYKKISPNKSMPPKKSFIVIAGYNKRIIRAAKRRTCDQMNQFPSCLKAMVRSKMFRGSSSAAR